MTPSAKPIEQCLPDINKLTSNSTYQMALSSTMQRSLVYTTNHQNCPPPMKPGSDTSSRPSLPSASCSAPCKRMYVYTRTSTIEPYKEVSLHNHIQNESRWRPSRCDIPGASQANTALDHDKADNAVYHIQSHAQTHLPGQAIRTFQMKPSEGAALISSVPGLLHDDYLLDEADLHVTDSSLVCKTPLQTDRQLCGRSRAPRVCPEDTLAFARLKAS